jgi:carboxymethylenebutenolidase
MAPEPRLAEQTLVLPAPDGLMRVYRVRPHDDRPAPGVVMYMDAVGFRPELCGLARHVAAQGYDCWLPDLYYRDGGPSFDAYTPNEDFDKFAPLMRKVTRQVVLGDTAIVLDRMNADQRVERTPLGCVGFCMGGRLALWAASAFATRFGAAASLHGGQLGTDAPDSPHRYASDLRSEVYLGFASDDPLVPVEHVCTICDALLASGVPFECETHPDTRHGYMFPERFCYNARAAGASWSKVFALFARRLLIANRDPGADAGQP